MSTIQIALTTAASGLPVFPCNAEKRPAISKGEGGKGLLDATVDPAVIHRMFARRNAILVGVPTGPISGFDVLDIDPRHGGHLWEDTNRSRLPETRIHETMSGGRHWLFQHAPRVRNSASREGFAEGVDVRGDGGYIIFPPSPGYRIISDAPIAHWPDWLLQPGLVLPKTRPIPTSLPASARQPIPQERLQRAFDSALDRVRRAGDGQKHFTLRNNALYLGGIAHSLGLSDWDLVDRLLHALPDGVEDIENARKTAEWGLEHGRQSPIQLPPEPEVKVPDPRRKALARLLFRMIRSNVDQTTCEAVAGREGSRLGLSADEICQVARWVVGHAREAA